MDRESWEGAALLALPLFVIPFLLMLVALAVKWGFDRWVYYV